MSRRTQRLRPKQSPVGDEREPAGKPWHSVRPARIERARKLIRDPGYPPRKIVDAVARLLAKHLRHGS